VSSTRAGCAWQVTDDTIRCLDRGHVVFSDTLEHWEHAVCRLLRIDDDRARAWVEVVAEEAAVAHGAPFGALALDLQIEALEQGSRRALGGHVPGGAALGGLREVRGIAPDTAWAADVGGDPRFAVVGSRAEPFGWLVELDTGAPPERPPVAYEEPYFQGGEATAYGYGDYEGQRWWREEKAARQLREVVALASYFGVELGESPRALDVGAGVGYFRAALASAGWRHEGVELSAYANAASMRHYGFDASAATLEELERTGPEPFAVITLWDVVEHVSAPHDLLAAVERLLAPGGLAFVRTPNLDCLEYDVFGSAYHSFKLDHLVYFSPPSLASALAEAGLEVRSLATQAHLLRGFLGASTSRFAALLRGSDILAVARRSRA
jgi:2-polyprenyl-3-methyl-5-hydroxy-6-metoxy-1,4-benzoquinol methylase